MCVPLHLQTCKSIHFQKRINNFFFFGIRDKLQRVTLFFVRKNSEIFARVSTISKIIIYFFFRSWWLDFETFEKEKKRWRKSDFIVGSIRKRSTLLTTLQLFDVSQLSKSLFCPDAALDGRWNSGDIIRETMFRTTSSYLAEITDCRVSCPQKDTRLKQLRCCVDKCRIYCGVSQY